MAARTRFASILFTVPAFCLLLLGATLPATAKNDWQSDIHKWVVSNESDPNCKVRYTVGVYRPNMGDQPAWGMMTEKMFKWFSKDGVKLAPSVCSARPNRAAYRILLSVSPMKTVSHTTHGSEVRTASEPFKANVTSRTTYSDGSTANSTATVNGEQTTTIVVPTETTISQSSVAQYMYTYRVNGEQLELIATDSVVFSRVAASGSGDNATGAELGAGIGNLIRASGDRHRADKLYEEALKAIRADARDNAAKQDAIHENYASERVPTDTQGTPSAVAQILTPTAATAPPSTAQAPANSDSIPSTESIAILKEQGASGDAEAQRNLGEAYETGKGVLQDYTQAAIWYHKAAEQGKAAAQFDLGGLYDDGRGVPQDYAQAAIWYRKAAEQGLADAQFNLGLMYHGGKGVLQDYTQAAIWYRKAAEQGLAVAQFNLGTLYYDGNGVPQNSAQAATWYRKAAEQGLAAAQDELGGLYETASGVTHDDAQAVAWYRKAAEQGDAKAQLSLGMDYFLGQGVPQNYTESYFWLNLATAAGKVTRIDPKDTAKLRELAAKNRDLTALLLTSAQLSRVQERARKWFEDHPTKPQ
jgi:TPR repeat protein